MERLMVYLVNLNTGTILMKMGKSLLMRYSFMYFV